MDRSIHTPIFAVDSLTSVRGQNKTGKTKQEDTERKGKAEIQKDTCE